MIANITQGNFTSGLLKYNEDKIKIGDAKLFHSNIYIPTSKNIKNIFFHLNGTSKRKDKNFHVSLNFLQEDFNKIGDKGVQNIIDDYLKEIGFPEDHPFVSYKHFDTKHPHIHIITSKILENGKALNDKFIFYNSQKISRKLENKYGITSIDKHYKIYKESQKNQRENISIETIEKKYKSKKISLSDFFNTTVTEVLEKEKPTSIEDLQQKLINYKINLNSVDYTYKGLIYRYKNDTSGIKSSQLKKHIQLKELEKTFVRNKKEKVFVAKELAKNIDFIFSKYNTIQTKTFINELKKKDIEVTPNITKGVLRGFRYYYKGYNLKGQELPKRAYTMAKIAHKFTEEKDFINENYWAKYKYKYNKDKIKHQNLGVFIYGSLKNGFAPIISDAGIIMKKPEYLLNNITSKQDEFLLNLFPLERSKLTAEEIEKINEFVYFYITLENIKDLENLENIQNQFMDNFTFEEFMDILQGEIYREDNDDMSNLPRKKRRKKRRL